MAEDQDLPEEQPEDSVDLDQAEEISPDLESLAQAGEDQEPEDQEKDSVDRELEIFQDLQRLQADFVNYRARVERDRGAERQAAIAEAIRAFLPALDDLTRAEAHGDMAEGTPMAAVAQKLKAAGEKFGSPVSVPVGPWIDAIHLSALA